MSEETQPPTKARHPQAARSAAAVGRALLPWIIGLAILAMLFYKVSFGELARAMAGVSVPTFLGLLLAYVVGLLVWDSLGTLVALRQARAGETLRYREVLWLRGASYLFQILAYAAGQGGFAVLLKRYAGVPLARCAGAVLLGIGANIVMVSVAAGLGVALGGAPATAALRFLLLGLAVALPCYLLVIALRPRFLRRFGFLQPLFDAGLKGHALVSLARLPHITTLILGNYAALHIFGVAIPLDQALIRLPLVFVVAVLPISPSGLGTSQTAAVLLLAPFVVGATPEAANATILAYSLALQLGSMLLQAGLGAGLLALLGRRRKPEVPA
jgi:hypothetical protein